jgi:hypothetical protein
MWVVEKGIEQRAWRIEQGDLKPEYLSSGIWFRVTGYWVLVAGYWVLGIGYWMLGTGCGVRVARCGVWEKKA